MQLILSYLDKQCESRECDETDSLILYLYCSNSKNNGTIGEKIKSDHDR